MPSRFIWHELFSTNLHASQSFYGELFNYRFKEQENGSIIFCNEDGPQGTITPINIDIGIPSHWVGYVTVEDIKRTIRKV